MQILIKVAPQVSTKIYSPRSLVLAQGLILVSKFQTSSAMDKVQAVKKSVLRQV